MLPSSRRQFTVMVNSNFASSSIRQPNIAWPRPSSADAKAFALNVTNGKYLGGITWGFDASAAGKVTKKNVEVFSMNNPTGEQAQALTKWNEQADFSGPDAAKKNAPDQEKVAEP
jgi:hypothetical protein